MNTHGKPAVAFDGYLYTQNRRNFPVEELQKYAGQWVAFSTDGTRILGGHPDMLTLAKILDEAGYNSSETVFTMVHADEVGLE